MPTPILNWKNLKFHLLLFICTSTQGTKNKAAAVEPFLIFSCLSAIFNIYLYDEGG